MSTYHVYDGYHRKRSWLQHLLILVVFMATVAACYLVSQRPPATTNAAQSEKPAQPSVAVAAPKITTPMPWPGYGHAAYGVAGNGVMAASDDAKAVPIASLAKVVTALAVIKEKPLQPGEQGPMITLTEQDVALFDEYIRKSGVVVPVEVGEQISQRQAMEAMLLTSANNMADILARWAFGSVEEYTLYANKMLHEMGLQNTTVADASGFSPNTVGTAGELTQLGIFYLQNPTLRQIATLPNSQIPVAGTIPNYNAGVNEDNILGIKIGNTDEAKRCFMVGEIRNVKGVETVSVAVILGAETMPIAMKDARTVLSAGNTGFDLLQTKQP